MTTPAGRLSLVRKKISKIEVERKFLPSSILEALLKDTATLQQTMSESDGINTAPPLNFRRQPNQVIRDTYFDLNGKLQANGLWVRYRTTKTVPSAGYPSINPMEFEQWEAKVRISGGYAKSEFVEVEGTKEVAEEVDKHVPGTTLTELQATADLETHRSSWTVEEGEAERENWVKLGQLKGICVALDHIVEAGHTYDATSSEEFRHYVGEVEMMGRAVTDGPDEHEAAKTKVTGEVSATLDEFLVRYQGLFLTHPEPMGKLGAFFTWKMARS